MGMLALGSAADSLGVLIREVPDAMLESPTPCPGYRLGDLIEHVGGLAIAFAAAAAKDAVGGSAAASGDLSRLGEDWRRRIPRDLAALAVAWRDPAAWTGMTRVGGIDLPGQVCGLVAADELVVHGWDVARASGLRFDCDREVLDAAREFLARSAAERPAGGPFGPVVPVADGAGLLDQVIGLSGRDPGWRPRLTV
jgi:uncharacterized protein (TIGR03086 family)